MSWFDTSGFASLAKTALKEAQKTIDKALDIKDEDNNKRLPLPSSAPSSSEFFSNSGIKDSDSSSSSNIQSPQQTGSIWGSFSGSFFENSTELNMTAIDSNHKESFPDFSPSEPADILQPPVVSPASVHPTKDLLLPNTENVQNIPESILQNDKDKKKLDDKRPTRLEIMETESSDKMYITTPSSQSTNQFPILSSESDIRSTESVEILGSTANTDCTNTPDSEGVSPLGYQRNSESVDLVTSPSSLEVLNDESPFISPYEDKQVEKCIFQNYEISNEKDKTKARTSDSLNTSSLGLKIISDAEEADEISVADDSYTSASESTSVTVVESCQKRNRSGKVVFTGSGSEYPIIESVKDKSSINNLHQPVETIKAKNQDETKHLDILKNTMIEPLDMSNTSENLEISDSCQMLTDSSCEETLVESSSEDNLPPDLLKLNENASTLTRSSYVKTMLADAMTEKADLAESDRCSNEAPRDNSPISSESRSDLVKIGSDQTSGHTSGDEIETTTSSDIEIISSPNGDSSSTQSRQSPVKFQSYRNVDLLTKTLKIRGHSRELSEVSMCSDDASLEIERLLRRVREITEILEARESKLIEVSRANMDLQEQNSNLKKLLDNVEKHVERNQDIRQLTDDYTQRLSALERKFQQAIRERDLLRKTHEHLKSEFSNLKLSNEILNVAEKDEIIKELREEGEKLSKQQLNHCNIIKKLRAKEKENDSTVKSQKEQIDELTGELERLKKSLHAKDEVERSQIEAVHSLTTKLKRQDKEILSLNEKLELNANKMEVYKRSFQAAKQEAIETKGKFIEAEEQLKDALENIGESTHFQIQIENLKVKLRLVEEASVRKEDLLKKENMELLKRLEAAESRSEEISESVSLATKPLLRHIEQLQLNISHKTDFYLKQEEIMTEKINDLQSKLETVSELNRSLQEESTNYLSKISVLETKLNNKETDRKKLEDLQETLRQENNILLQGNEQLKKLLKCQEDAHNTKIQEFQRQINSLENKLSIEKAAMEAEKRKNQSMVENQHSTDEELRYSPTLSVERDSVCSANSVWQPFMTDSIFETSSGRFPNTYNSNSTSTIENLQAQLKQRDGEIQHLQWEISRRNTERDALNTEVCNLTSKISKIDTLKENLNDIQTKYDALLQLYGEKIEENQELKLDLVDVKEMYKTQIDQLLRRDQ